ncbi:MAG: hypothetical protein ICV72_05880 [Aldersonia sp.]|nr:hypothetical protein [Aldersonia sp.]
MSSYSVLFTDPPSTPQQLAADPPDREAQSSAELDVEVTLDVPADRADIQQFASRAYTLAADGNSAETASTELRIAYRPGRIGERAVPASVPVELLDPPDAEIIAAAEQRLLDSLGGDATKATAGQLDELQTEISRRVRELPRLSTEAHIPTHLPVRSSPEPAPKSLPIVQHPELRGPSADGRPMPTTVFAPENRQVLWDTAYRGAATDW